MCLHVLRHPPITAACHHLRDKLIILCFFQVTVGDKIVYIREQEIRFG
uniref:Uncharacterized protein n=1 Tax=Arundo donax TaxID=35708 RepID=A0A0A9G8Y7_ARUDO